MLLLMRLNFFYKVVTFCMPLRSDYVVAIVVVVVVVFVKLKKLEVIF